MQQTATEQIATGGSSTAASLPVAEFAALLSTLLAPAEKSSRESAPKSGAEWEDDDFSRDLADDVATLSYERAMRSHARYHPQIHDDQPLATDDVQEYASSWEPAGNVDHLSAQVLPPKVCSSDSKKKSEAVSRALSSLKQNVKCASVTIRLSKAEYSQLHQRAAEAGLTVSAYLRSCTFEVESLRAEVKETLAQLRLAPSPAASASGTAEAPLPLPAQKLPQKLPWLSSLRSGRSKRYSS